MAHGYKTGGRRAGTPNKVTSDTREAICQLLEGNSHKLSKWIDAVADGVTVVRRAKDGSESFEYLVKPNPAKAFDMFQSLLEFHVPKLMRMQVGGNDMHPFANQNNLGIFDEILQAIKIKKQSESRLTSHSVVGSSQNSIGK
jgi:hypothetical protein